MPLRVAVLFSGGKDSTFAVWYCRQKKFEVKFLLTMAPKSKESYMFHYPNIKWTRLQAESMGIRQHMRHTDGVEGREVSDLGAAIRPLRHEIDAIAAGGLASTYQADRIGKVAQMLNLKPVVPFWHTEIRNYWRMILEAGFEVIITGVAADGLGREWLGKKIGLKELDKLKELSDKYKFNLGGEGGEYESMVLDGPIFKRKLVPLSHGIEWDSDTCSGFYIIKDMMSIDKMELANLMREHSHKKEAIRKRLEEFEAVGSTSNQERLFAELAFCLCTPQSKARLCWAAVEGLEKKGLLIDGKAKDIERNLGGVRFHRNKARYIENARTLMSVHGRLDVRGFLTGLDGKDAREKLVTGVKGLGYKEASHFLRNIGMGKGIAILDRHILKNLKKLGVIDEVPKTLSPKKYREIESRMSAFCAHVCISEEELDLLLWSKETGEIFK